MRFSGTPVWPNREIVRLSAEMMDIPNDNIPEMQNVSVKVNSLRPSDAYMRQ